MNGRRYRKRSTKARTTAKKVSNLQKDVRKIKKLAKKEYYTCDRYIDPTDCGSAGSADYFVMHLNPFISPIVENQIRHVGTCSGFSKGLFGIEGHAMGEYSGIPYIEGQEAYMTSLQYTIDVTKNSAATESIVRLMIVLDKEPDLLLLDPNEVIGDYDPSMNGTSVATNWNWMSYKRMENKDRYKILKEHLVTLTENDNVKVIKKTIRLNKPVEIDRRKKVINDADNEEEAGEVFPYKLIQKNAIWLVAVSDEPADPGQYPKVKFQSRIIFTDV
jgi:hypothetical protein